MVPQVIASVLQELHEKLAAEECAYASHKNLLSMALEESHTRRVDKAQQEETRSTIQHSSLLTLSDLRTMEEQTAHLWAFSDRKMQQYLKAVGAVSTSFWICA
jgi:membrane glycosyltransferase